MDEHSETLLHILSSLKSEMHTVTVQTVKSSMAWAAAGIDYDSTIDGLVKNGYVAHAGQDCLALTQKGILEAAQIRDKKVQQEFDYLIDRCTQSSAYLDFCEELYGYRLYLFNMLDKRQLDDLFASLRLSPEDTVLDMGCGTAALLNRISQRYGCKGTGVDRLKQEIVNRVSPAIDYRQTDMDEVLAFDVSAVLFVDSLYFSRDMSRLLSRLKGSGAKAYMYYSTYLFEETGDYASLRADQTPLAKALSKLGLAYKTADYSEAELLLYRRGVKLLDKYKTRFAEQGIGDIYERRFEEYGFGAQLYDKGRASRYLYTVENT